MKSPRFTIRKATAGDVPSFLAIRDQLAVNREFDHTREGFLLGSNPEGYHEIVSAGLSLVLVEAETNGVMGVGLALPWEMLRKTDIWHRRGQVQWTTDCLPSLESGKPAYLDQLAIVPSPSTRYLAPGLAMSLVENLCEQDHSHILATTVIHPIRNRAALKLLKLVHAELVGEIDETYPGIGPIRSAVHCISTQTYRELRNTDKWQARLLNYMEKTAWKRQPTG